MIQFDEHIFQMGWFNQLASNVTIFVQQHQPIDLETPVQTPLQDDVEEEEAWAVWKKSR